MPEKEPTQEETGSNLVCPESECLIRTGNPPKKQEKRLWNRIIDEKVGFWNRGLLS